MTTYPHVGAAVEVCGVLASFLAANPVFGSDSASFTVRATPGNANMIAARCAEKGAQVEVISESILVVSSTHCVWVRSTSREALDDDSVDIIYGGALAADAARVAVRFQRQLWLRSRFFA